MVVIPLTFPGMLVWVLLGPVLALNTIFTLADVSTVISTIASVTVQIVDVRVQIYNFVIIYKDLSLTNNYILTGKFGYIMLFKSYRCKLNISNYKINKLVYIYNGKYFSVYFIRKNENFETPYSSTV